MKLLNITFTSAHCAKQHIIHYYLKTTIHLKLTFRLIRFSIPLQISINTPQISSQSVASYSISSTFREIGEPYVAQRINHYGQTYLVIWLRICRSRSLLIDAAVFPEIQSRFPMTSFNLSSSSCSSSLHLAHPLFLHISYLVPLSLSLPLSIYLPISLSPPGSLSLRVSLRFRGQNVGKLSITKFSWI